MNKNYALFSDNGRFIGFTNFIPKNGLYKEMPDQFDPVTQVYIGDYNTGQLKPIEELQQKDFREANIDKKWKIFESDLDKEVELNIIKGLKYPLYKQLNIIMEVIEKNKEIFQLTEEFSKMYNDISRLRYNHKKSLKGYEDAPKAELIYKDQEKEYVEEYTKKQLNLHDPSSQT